MNKQRIGLRLLAEVICVICLGYETARAALTPSNYAVQIDAQANDSPARIDLHWIVDGDAKSYTIKKKLPTAKEWVQLTQVGGSTSSYSDSQITVGSTVEYQIIKETDNGYTGYGYIYAGIKKPLVEQRGRIILVIESSLADPLKTEIDRLSSDLLGENWRVSRITVSQNDSVSSVKSKIKAIYDSDAGNTKAVLLLGHVPVPYSGDIEPDEHDNHRGAWPADVYYGDLDGTWTDNSVNRTSAERSINWNVPGDGKFDQSYIPSAVELQVGRVDFWWMTCFSNKTPSRSEIDLTRQYLDKNHNFRRGYVVPARTGLLLDQFGLRYPEPLAAMSWRNLSALVGSGNITATTDLLFPRASDQSFLFGFVSGGGSWTYSTA
ncbi:MAG: fibronectin type III domain-containing protein, partial [Verrucomicrobiota bacterium]